MRTRSLLIPTLALLAGSGIAQAADDMGFQIHGLVSQGYLLTHNNALFTPQSEDNGTFGFNEMALNVVATPVDRLRVGIQIAAQDLGDTFNNELTLDWAYGNYNFGEVVNGVDLSVSAGRFKMGHGLYNDYRDLDMTRSSVFLPMAVYNPRWREIMLAINGVGSTAMIAAGALGSFEVNGYVGNTNVSASEGTLHDTFGDIGLDTSSLTFDYIAGGQITWNTPLEGLRLKYSLVDASNFEVLGTSDLLMPGADASFTIPNYWDNIFSLEYQWNDLTVAGEYNYTFFHSTFVPAIGVPFAVEGTTATHSTYISAAYRLHPKWEVLGGWQWSESDNTQNGKSKWYALNAAVRYDVTEHWLIKAEYQWTHGKGLLRSAEQPDGTTEEIWSFIALKTTFDF